MAGPHEALERLQAAINGHDVEAMAACFAPDFESRHPAHPERSFHGSEQVRANWTAIFAGVPDIRAVLVRSVESGDEVWAQWEWSGTRRDGAPHEMRGVTVVGVDGDDRIAWTDFYMEILEQGGVSSDAARAALFGREVAS